MADIEIDGLRYHVQRLGAGEHAVVFIHGLVMDNLSSWYFTLANPLATVAEVMLYDLRGHGRSQRSADGYTMTQMRADLLGVLDHTLGDRPVTLVGNSYGALLALSCAIEVPERVASLVVVDGHLPDADWAGEMQRTLRLSGPERDRLILEHFQEWLGRHSVRKRNRLAANASELIYETSLVDDLGQTPVYDDAQLAQISCPVLAVYGGDSDILSHGKRLESTIPDCNLRVYPGCTHSVIWEATTDLRADVLDWIKAR